MASRNKSSPPASPATGQAPDPIPKLAITFGIEFECVLTFHGSKLRRVLEDNGVVATVRKDLLPQEHTAVLGSRQRDSHRRGHFPCWGLNVAADELAIGNFPLYSYGTFRPYFVEPLLIAKTPRRCASFRPML